MADAEVQLTFNKTGLGGRARIFTGRKIYLLQFHANRYHANLANETRWQRAGTNYF